MTSVATRAKPLGGAGRSNRSLFRSPSDSAATPHERFVFAMLNLVGKWVTVTVKSGQEFTGILHTCCPDKEPGIVLSMAREKQGPDDIIKVPEERLIILNKDFMQLVAHDVDMYGDQVIEGGIKNQGEVLADTEIEVAGRGAGAERELEAASSAWLTGGDASLELGKPSEMKSWDQFSHNERHHGVRSSYSDELYTTKISDKQFTPEQLAAAERLAKEIEKGVTSSAHVLEERGLKELDDDGDMDEEEKYSMVLDPSRVGATAATAAAPAAAAPPEPTPGSTAAPAAATPATTAAAPSEATPEPAAPKPAVASKLRPTAVEFVPGKFKAAAPAAPPAHAPPPPMGVPPGAPPAPPGAPPGPGYMQGSMHMPGGMPPMSPGAPAYPQQGMGMPMGPGPVSHEQAAQHAAQQHAAQQQMAMMRQAQMQPGVGAMVPMGSPPMRPGVMPGGMPAAMMQQGMPGNPAMMQQGMMPPAMLQQVMYSSGGGRPVPPQQPMPPRMHPGGPPGGPRMMPPAGYPPQHQQMAMRPGHQPPPYGSPPMGPGYAAPPPMGPRPEG